MEILRPTRQKTTTAEGVVMDNPKPAKIAKLGKTSTDSSARLYVVLEMAPLETVKVGGEYRLLNSDDHAHQLKKHNRDPADSRPDIVHQCLLALLDSPLAKSGKLQIFIHTQRDILIEVNPLIRIPRTYKRFAGLMVQLLQKLSVKAADGNHSKLLKVIKNPVTKHLPVGAKRILMSPHAASFVNIHDYVETTPLNGPTVFVIGAMAKGVCKVDYADEEVCISNFSLSAASVCSKLCYAYEEYFNII